MGIWRNYDGRLNYWILINDHKAYQRTGIDPKRISVVGYGECRPKADNKTEEGRVDSLILTSEYNDTEQTAQ
mgnify:FL=1